MAAVTWLNVIDIAASMVDVPLEAQTQILGLVNNELNAAAFGGELAYRTRLARLYLAAHLGYYALPKNSGGTGIAGPVIAEATSQVSRQYANIMSASKTRPFSGTIWGQQYEALVDTSFARLPRVP